MICLVAETPVAGTIARLSKWIGHYSGEPCLPVIMRNYANNCFDLPTGALGTLPDWRTILADIVRKAKTIIIHNIYDNGDANRERLEIIFGERQPGTKILFQIHSPPIEGPAMLYSTLQDYDVDHEMVVSQGHGRFHPNAVSVPNIVPDLTFPFAPEKQRSIFASHLRTTSFRWSSKLTEQDMAKLRASQEHYSGYEFVSMEKVFGRQNVTHDEMMLYLMSVSIMLEDINTGMMHQTAFEGLKAGASVFSAADLYTIEQACETLKMDIPPFRFVQNVDDVIDMLRDPMLRQDTKARMKASREFADKFLGEERTGQIYWDQIRPLL